MDLKEFKILKESDDAFQIGHPNGKPITIKKRGLNEKSHALIQKLKGRESFEEGGFVGPEDPSADADLDALTDPGIPEYLRQNTPEEMAQHSGFSPTDQVTGGQPMPEPPLDATGSAGLFNSPGSVGGTTTADATGSNGLMTKGEFNQSPSNQMPVEAPAQAAQDPLDQKQSGLESSLEAQKRFQTNLGKIEADRAAAEVKAIDDMAALQTQQDIYNQYKAKDEGFMNMMQQQNVDPNRYLNNRSTGTKIAQGIALVLGGIGSGLTGQPNAALGLIKDFIDKDIEAQKNDQSKTMNLWKMNREALGSDLAANLATQNQLYTGAKYQIMKAGAQAQSKAAIERAGMANALTDQAIEQNRLKLSLLTTPVKDEATFTRRNAGLKMYYPEMAKDEEDKYIPGVGVASVKPTEKDREALNSARDLQKDLVELQALATQGMTVPGTKANAVNKQKVAAVQLKMKNAYQLGVLSQSDLDMLEKLTADPGSMFSERSIAQLKSTQQSMKNLEQGIMGKLGVKPFAKGAETQTRNGIQYKKVPGGWEPVK